jgi:predicted HicB family RNase H-like nuclease
MKQTTKTTLYLPEHLHAEVKIEAARHRISMTRLIIEAIEHKLEELRSGKIDRDPMAKENDK